MYFAHDLDLYQLKLNDDTYFLTTFLQKILFENLNTLPSFRLRIVLRQFCRSFVEHYCSSVIIDRDTINDFFLTFLDLFLPYIQQRLTSMWTNLLSNTSVDYQNGECSDEMIEECVCVLLTRDFVDIIRYFIFKASNSTSIIVNGQQKKKSKLINGHHQNDSMCDEINGINVDVDADHIDEWDEQTLNTQTNSISNRLANGTQEKVDYSELFLYMMKMARQGK
jgi:hypothetical protein